MTAQAKIEPPALAKLREPFPDHQISKLPKETRSQIDARKADKNLMVFNCQICGGHHHKNANHLDYVGHAALTDRLLDTDPSWSWEPVAFNDAGLPAFDATGGLWIRLTVCGVTRLGYGHAAVKPNMDPGAREKEVIGDALRNAAMRFGAALDLWHKGDLHAEDDEPSKAPANDRNGTYITPEQRDILIALLKASGASTPAFLDYMGVKRLDQLPADKFEAAKEALDKRIQQNSKKAPAPTQREAAMADIIADEVPY